MSILSRLFGGSNRGDGSGRQSSDPMAAIVDEAVARYWTKNKSLGVPDHPEDFVRQVADKLREHARSILDAEDRIAACRAEIVPVVWNCARYQVLVIEPPPAEDPTGLRGRFGISGELKPYISRLVTLDSALVEAFKVFPAERTDEETWQITLMSYGTAWASAHVINAVRRGLGDCHPDMSKDWFKPFYVATCAWVEWQYRKQLGLPELLNKDGSGGPALTMLYMRFSEFVERGDKFPDVSWRELALSVFPDIELP